MTEYPEVDLSGERLRWPSGTRDEYVSPYFPRTLVLINPSVTTFPIPMGAVPDAVEIYRIDYYIHGTATPSVTFKLFTGSDCAGTGAEVVVDGITCTQTTLQKHTDIDNGMMDADDEMWATITAKSGTVNALCVIPRCRIRS